MLHVLWAAFFALAFVCGAANGRLGEVSAALTEGAAGAVTLAISIAGLMCFWSGIMEVMQQSGLTAVMLGSSETSIYTISLYAGHLGLRETRYAIPAALCADLAAFMMSAALADKLFPIC